MCPELLVDIKKLKADRKARLGIKTNTTNIVTNIVNGRMVMANKL